ncbi:MAG: hypothetical protein O7B35_09330 [Deltaproteobacteria bacterium]|nr:hypothetical protein [Deltaproteobacteria bacterium]
MLENQSLRDTSNQAFFTCDSNPDLVGKLAARVHQLTRRRRKDRFFFLKNMSEQEKTEVKTSGFGRRDLGFERCSGLSCTVRVFWMPRKPYLLLDFAQHPHSTEDELRGALLESSPEKMKALDAAIKKLTIHVGFSGLAGNRRFPWQIFSRMRDRQRFSGTRKPIKYLFDPQQPLNEIRGSYTKGKKEKVLTVGSLKIKIQAEALYEKGAPRSWRTIYIDPRQPIDEVRLHLLLYLRQEGMIDKSVNATLCELVQKCFKIKDQGDAILVLHGDKPREGLLNNFTLPEDWRAMRLYVRRVKWSFKRENAQSAEIDHSDDLEKVQEIKERKTRGRVYAGTRGKPPEKLEIKKADDKRDIYSVKQAVKQLNTEGYEVSPDRLHDWINKGQIKCEHTQRGGKPLRCLDDGILEAVRQKLKPQRNRRLLIDHLTKTKERETARKYINRHLQKGESIEDIKRLVTQTQREP